MRDALWTDPFDQSLWFYYQYLMSNLVDYVGRPTIVPSMVLEDRIEYINKQLVGLRDMLDGAEDCKWIYNALFDYTLAIIALQEREPAINEMNDLEGWLGQLRTLDPSRNGRWYDLDKQLHHH